jgi:uncharacterized protein with von Willebrand factor type A (vWA) domain
MSDDLAAKVVEFCSRLRREHGFSIGPPETREALRAIETVGIGERAHVAAALRSVCCSRAEEIEPFDRAFAAFFSTDPLGEAQPKHAERRRTRPDRTDRREENVGTRAQRPSHATPRDEESGAAGLQKTAEPQAESLADAWQGMRARYSPSAATAEPPSIPTDVLETALAEANRLVTRLHLGRSLRWKPRPRGERFDLRRTLRASLRTGGDVIAPRMLGHPLRNPRFVVLLDGSRSMSEHAARTLQFAHALCKRTRRASAFLFSTRLCEVTRELRDAGRGGSYLLGDLGEAWGGGTRIGASLSEFVRTYGARLSDQTFVIVISDGLDVGDIALLRRAMHEIARRSAAIAWVNPHVGQPGYTPSARGMQAALPYVTTLSSLDDMHALTNLGRRARVTVDA